MGFIAFLKFTLICIELLAWPVLGLVYPLFASVRAIESNSKYHLRKLVIYWTIFSLISLFEFAFVKIIEWIPFWSSIKLVVIFWLVMPAFDGANIAYQSFVCRWLLLDLQEVSNMFYKPNKEKLHEVETFLDVADKYIKENGYEALEKLISIKRDCQVADNSQRDILVLESALEHKLKEPDAPKKCDEVEEAKEKHASTEAKENWSVSFTACASNKLEAHLGGALFSFKVQNGKEAASAEIKNVTPPPPPQQEIRQEWACILCEVKTASETTLNAHLQGKKHKSMLESLKRNQGQKEANKKKAGEGSRKKTEERVEKNVELWCNVCKVKFPSEIHKAAHFKGTNVEGSTKSWGWIWKSNLPQKLKLFLWLCHHDPLLTNSLRFDRNFATLDDCPRCSRDRESVLHALLWCKFSKPVWEFVIAPTEFLSFWYMSNTNWFEENLKANFHNIILPQCPWPFFFMATIFTIWKSRNLWIFQNRREPIRLTVLKVKTLASDLYSCFSARTIKKILRENVIWKKPEEHWFKLNTDGSVFRGNTAAAGGLIRDWKGTWIQGFSMKLGDNTITVAELLGLREGLKMAWERRLEKLVVEVDSQVILKLVEEADSLTHPLGSIIEDCRIFCRKPWTLKLQHTLREGNQCADVLAKLGHQCTNCRIWTEPPPEVLSALLGDGGADAPV